MLARASAANPATLDAIAEIARAMHSPVTMLLILTPSHRLDLRFLN